MNDYYEYAPEYKDYIDPEDNGWVHEDDIPDLEFIKDMLVELTCSIYKSGDMDILQSSLEEILAAFDLKLPDQKPLLQKVPTIRRHIIQKPKLMAQ